MSDPEQRNSEFVRRFAYELDDALAGVQNLLEYATDHNVPVESELASIRDNLVTICQTRWPSFTSRNRCRSMERARNEERVNG